jgi:hypothetical protein
MRHKLQIIQLEWTGNKSGCGGGRMQFYQLNELENRAELCMCENVGVKCLLPVFYNLI